MAGLPASAKKSEYLDILDETIHTNPYRKAATAMISVMAKHGIKCSSSSGALGSTSFRVPEKRCALSRSLTLAQGCNTKLNTVKDDLETLCTHLSLANPSGDLEDVRTDKVSMTGHLLTLIGEAETISKRIYETAIGLHVAEDFLRQPEDLKLLDFSTNGRIQIPNYNFNHASQLCLEWLYTTAFKWLRGFKIEPHDANDLCLVVFENFTKAVKDFTDSVCLANQVFRVLLYTNAVGKKALQEYVMALGYVLKNDIIMEVQSLRRAFDNIQCTLERIGWAASIAWMKYSGKNVTAENLNESGVQVDHSNFQYKFYEASVQQKKSRTIQSSGSSGKTRNKSTKKSLMDGRNSESTLTAKRRSDRSIHTDGEHESDGGGRMVEATKVKLTPLHPRTAIPREGSEVSQVGSRKQARSASASATDVPKPGKTLFKAKLKRKKSVVAEKEDTASTTPAPNTITSNPATVEPKVSTESSHAHSTGDAQLLKECEKWFADSTAAPNVNDNPSTSTTSQQPLTPAPNIPDSIRQQLDMDESYEYSRPVINSKKGARGKLRSKINGAVDFTSKASKYSSIPVPNGF